MIEIISNHEVSGAVIHFNSARAVKLSLFVSLRSELGDERERSVFQSRREKQERVWGLEPLPPEKNKKRNAKETKRIQIKRRCRVRFRRLCGRWASCAF